MVAQIAQLPTPPSRADSPNDFSLKADAFLGALPDFRTQTNNLANEIEGIGNAADADRIAAANSATASANSASASASSASASAASALQSADSAQLSEGAARKVFGEFNSDLLIDRLPNTSFASFYGSKAGVSGSKVIDLGSVASTGFSDENIPTIRIALSEGGFNVNLGTL